MLCDLPRIWLYALWHTDTLSSLLKSSCDYDYVGYIIKIRLVDSGAEKDNVILGKDITPKVVFPCSS